MMLELLFRDLASKSQRPSSVGRLVLDVTLEEEHRFSAEITDHPIEQGGVIQDHVGLGPRVLRITGFVTDTPLVARGLPLGSVRTASAYQMLEQLWERRQPFQVVTKWRSYPRMVVENLTIPRNSRESALRFDCTLKELTLVSSQNTTIPASSGTAEPGLQSATGGGIGALSPERVSRPAVDTSAVDVGRPAARTAENLPAPEVVPERRESWLRQVVY